MRRAITSGLVGLEHVRRDAGDLTARRRVALLMVARGRAWTGLGEPASARRDLAEASDRLLPLLPRLSQDEARDARQRLATGWIDLAEVLAAAGDVDGARATSQRAIGVAAAPEIVVDQVRSRPGLASLADALAP